ncbi:hypothetical protein TNCV_4471051 [Trichonephila clavipes]|uniref:Uncharacterized protein n=1 Tax=Trichonephila clavipes TaxID=2585209 RepID=A0A8X6VFU6_TRICX|nr:hypothetical protein TNCV_4471051 [Trichonephila clavipes]
MVDIWINDSNPMSHTTRSSSTKHMQVNVTTEGDIYPKHDSTTSEDVSFNSDGSMSTEAPCFAVQETCVLLPIISAPVPVVRLQGISQLVVLHRDLHCEDVSTS